MSAKGRERREVYEKFQKVRYPETGNVIVLETDIPSDESICA